MYFVNVLTQGPEITLASKVKALSSYEPLKKEAVKHDKKKFTDALSKFGFGLPDPNKNKKVKKLPNLL